MDDAIDALKAYDWGGNRGGLMKIDERIVAAQGDQEKLAPIEDALLGVLQSDAALPAKEYCCRKLALIGTNHCVPALAAMLTEPLLAGPALFALQAIPDPAAGEALCAALQNTSGTQRIGIVNALGERCEVKALPLLQDYENDPDKSLSAAAKAAIRKIEACS